MLSKAPCAVTGLRESVNSLLIYHTHAGILFTLEKGVSQLSSISLSHVQWRSNDYTERLKGSKEFMRCLGILGIVTYLVYNARL